MPIAANLRLQAYPPARGSAIQMFDSDRRSDEVVGSRDATDTSSEGAGGEARRGLATVLFTDIVGYTAMSESLDPEDLREATSEVFTGVSRIVESHDGIVDKLMGDAALVLFGAHGTREDDAVRAVSAAMEIHDFVARISPEVERSLGYSLVMHSGIATGVIVTSSGDDSSADSALGDTVNLASRLSDLADAGDILVSVDTYAQTHGYFDFEDLGTRTVRGREKSVRLFRLSAPRLVPKDVHRLFGVRSRLIGRGPELELLEYRALRLSDARPAVISVSGEAGAGKSRLVEELRESEAVRDIQWLSGSAREHYGNVPYHPFSELISHAWEISDDDTPSAIRDKIDSRLRGLPGVSAQAPAFIGSLFSLDHPELHDIDSERWRAGFSAAMQSVLAAMASQTPTIIYLGDLHWADSSSVNLIRDLVESCGRHAMFLLAFRPPFELYTEGPPEGVEYREIRLESLSSSETMEMLASLLETEEVPRELHDLVQQKAEGNPFYIEELVNSLIESGGLFDEAGNWRLSTTASDVDVPLTVVGVISTRLDRLDSGTREVLQEAAAIGRRFTRPVLELVTSSTRLGEHLAELEGHDLIHPRRNGRRAEYTFKHALIQDVAYESLLRPQRLEVHERIGVALEGAYPERVDEMCETLAHHFSNGLSTDKAIDYLMRSGKKSLRRSAVAEADQYYRLAFGLASDASGSTDGQRRLIELLSEWGFVIYEHGDMATLEKLLLEHQDVAESLGPTREHAMFRVCQGMALHCREKFHEARRHLESALDIGHVLRDEYVVACASVWLSNVLSELGEPEEAVSYALQSEDALVSDPVYYSEALSALGFAYWTKGEAPKAIETGERLLAYGRERSSRRALAAGFWVVGEGHLADGSFALALEYFRESLDVAADPWSCAYATVYMAIAHIQMDQFEEAESCLATSLAFGQEHGAELVLNPSNALFGIAAIARGDMGGGMATMEAVRSTWHERDALMRYSTVEAMLGQVYLQIVSSDSTPRFGTLVRNVPFLLRYARTAAKRSEEHFMEAVRICSDTGALGPLGEAYLGLGRLYLATDRTGRALEALRSAVDCFEDVGITGFRDEALELLEKHA